MPVTIENHILHSPFLTPSRHWRISDDGITIDGRRRTGHSVAFEKADALHRLSAEEIVALTCHREV